MEEDPPDDPPDDWCRISRAYKSPFKRLCLNNAVREIEESGVSSDLLEYNIDHFEELQQKRAYMGLIKGAVDRVLNGEGVISQLEYDASRVELAKRRRQTPRF